MTFEESVEAVIPLLGGAIRPTMFLLHDGQCIAMLTVDPDVAFAALQAQNTVR